VYTENEINDYTLSNNINNSNEVLDQYKIRDKDNNIKNNNKKSIKNKNSNTLD